MDIAAEQRRRSFCVWLRTGGWPALGDQPEVKFNPWHDPKDGRFTFSGSGRYYGPGGATGQENGGAPRVIKFGYAEDPRLAPISTREEADAWRASELAKFGHDPDRRRAIEEQYKRYLAKLADSPSSQAEAIPNAAPPEGQQGGGERQPRPSHQSARREGASGYPARSSAPQARKRREPRSWTGGGFTGGVGRASAVAVRPRPRVGEILPRFPLRKDQDPDLRAAFQVVAAISAEEARVGAGLHRRLDSRKRGHAAARGSRAAA